MRVLVTGHGGYLGSILVPELVRAGHAVTGLDSGLFDDCVLREADFPDTPVPVRTIRKDIRETAPGDFEGQDAVIHLAGLSNDPLGSFDPDLTKEINHLAAVRVARHAKSAGVRILLAASSCSVYGASGDELLTETSPFAPVTPYAVSKLRMEEDIGKLADASFAPVFLRSGTVYGLSPMIRFDLVVNNLVAWACATGEVFLKSDGKAWRPLVHAADVARSFAAMVSLPAERVGGEAFNIADNAQNVTIIELAKKIAGQVCDGRLRFSRTADTDRRNYKVSGDKLLAMLGGDWFRYDVDSEVTRLAEAFRKAKLTPEDIEGARFSRLPHLKRAIACGRIDDRLFASPVLAD